MVEPGSSPVESHDADIVANIRRATGDSTMVSGSVTSFPAQLRELLSVRGLGEGDTAATVVDPRASAECISFIFGFPDRASLPNATVAEATQRALLDNPEWALNYGKTTGVPELADVLLAKLRRDQGIVAGQENLIITAGGSQALQLVLDLLIDPGDVMICESPTWMGFIDAVQTVRGRLETVPLDENGLDVVALEAKLRELADAGTRAKFIYIISNFQNPSGISTTVERRKQIAELAAEYGTLVLEDDAYHDLRYAGERIPPIYTLDTTGHTMYLGTMSKIMGAGMRLGWLVANEEIILRMARLKTDGGTSIFGSYVAAEWIPAQLDDHIANLKEIYGRRRDIMLEALAEHMPEGSTWTKPDGGFFIWLTLPEQIDAGKMRPMARERGIEYLPGATCFADGSGKNTIRLSFSFATDDQIVEGIRILGEVIRAELMESYA
jgi:2-aminoadipate transaminase